MTQHETTNGDTDGPIAIDLFCGAGGASLGIDQAGYDTVAAIDQNTTALDTHADNLPGYTINHDLSDIDPEVLPERAQSPDYIHGSPPCQGFSTANDDRNADDPRNSLVFDFIDWVAELRPPVATMENVTGMTNITDHFMDTLTGAFRDAGYTAKWRVLNAADYGVPQTRKRVITVAIRDDIEVSCACFPTPTHAETPTTTLTGETLEKWVTVEDAIGDLAGKVQTTMQGVTSDPRWRAATEPSGTVGTSGAEYARQSFKLTDQINEAHQRDGRRPLQDSGDPSNVIRGGTPPLKIPLQHDDPGLSSWDKKYDYQVAQSTTKRDTPSTTIHTGHGVMPWHYNHNPRTTNTNSPRRLTVRECARLQSFPDWFVFSGSKTAQHRQVGNAVPPLLQYHIAAHLQSLVFDRDAPTQTTLTDLPEVTDA